MNQCLQKSMGYNKCGQAAAINAGSYNSCVARESVGRENKRVKTTSQAST